MRTPIAMVRGARAAFTLLSRIPVGGFPYRDDEVGWASGHYPLVGLVVGGCSAAVAAPFLRGDGALPAIVALLVSVLLTGAFHEDGLADSADALGGAFGGSLRESGPARDKFFAILKDSRVGTYGALALLFSVLLRAAALARIGPHMATAIIVTHTLARAPMTWLLAWLPYVTPDATARNARVAHAGAPQVALATVWSVLPLAAAVATRRIASLEAMALLGVLVAITIGGGRYFKGRVGGVTGDLLGALEQSCECALLLAWTCILPA